MSDVEFILRIVLKARDEMAGALGKARGELSLFAAEAEKAGKHIDALNGHIDKLNGKLDGLRGKVAEIKQHFHDTGGEVGDLGDEFDDLSESVGRSGVAAQNTHAKVRELRGEFRNLRNDFEQGKRSREDVEFGFKRIGDELDKLAKKASIGSDLSFAINRTALDVRQAHQKIIDEDRAATRIRKEITRDESVSRQGMLAEMLDAMRGRTASQEKAISDITSAEAEDRKRTAEGERVSREGSDRRAEASAKQRATFLRGILNEVRRDHERQSSDIRKIEEAELNDHIRVTRQRITIDEEARRRQSGEAMVSGLGAFITDIKRGAVNIEEARAGLKRYASDLGNLSRAQHVSSEEARHFGTASEVARSALADLSKDSGNLVGRIESIGLKMQSAGVNVRSLGAEMRGLIILSIIGLFQQLSTVVVALGGNLLALASSAGVAATALGGALVAGAAQAIPVLGLLAASVQRVGVVMQALKLQQQAQQQEFVQQQTRDKRQANSSNAVADAMDGIVQAQERLDQARHDAVRQLQDLIAKEREAELQARSANLSVEEAQRALRQAVQGGDDIEVRRARLALDQAREGRTQAGVNLQRAHADSAAAQARGVANAQQVVAAERALEQSKRGLENAQRTAAVAQDQAVTAQRNLDFFLQHQLDESERALFRVLSRIQHEYLTTFKSVTDIIIDSFTHVALRVEKIFSDPKVLGALTLLATAIADAVTKIGDSLLSDKSIAQFGRITAEAMKNLGPLTDILINVGKLFTDIAEGAGPAFHDLVVFVKDLSDRFADFIDGARRSGELTDFFRSGIKQLEQWIDLLGSVINLFAAIAGPGGGAESGLRIITRITDGLNGMAESIRKNPEGLQKFFRESEEVLGQLYRLFKALAIAIIDSFDPKSVEALVNILVEIVIPALKTIIEAIGLLVRGVERVLSVPIIGDLAKWALAFIGVYKAVTTLARLLGSTIIQFDTMAKSIAGLYGAGRTGLGGLKAAFEALVSGGGIKGAIQAFKDYITQAKRAKIATEEAATASKEARLVGQGTLFPAGGAAGGGVLGRVGGIRGVAKVAGKLGAAAAALDFGVNLVDSKGNPIAAGINTAHDLTFGLVPKVKITSPEDLQNEDLRKFADQINRLNEQHDARGLAKIGTEIRKSADEARDFNDEKLADQYDKLADSAEKAAGSVGRAAVGIGRFADSIKGKLVKADDIIDPNAVAQFLSNLNRMRDQGVDSISDLRSNMRFNLSQITKGLEENSDSWRISVARNFGAGIDALKRAMAEGTISTKEGMAEINRITKRQMEFVRDNMDDLSDEAKTRLAGNFRNARLAIEAQVGGIENATGKTLRRIRKLMEDEFALLGLDPDSARRLARNRTTAGRQNVDQFGSNDRAGGGAVGGFFGQQGERGADGTGPMLGARPTGAGEALLNWAHQKYVGVALQNTFGHGLGEMFNRVHGEHSWRSPGGLARGLPPGIVPIPGMAGEFIHRSILNDVLELIRKYHARVTDGWALSGHAPGGEHPKGLAVDLVPGEGGNWGMITQLANWAEPSQNNPRKPFRWVGYTGDPNHGPGNHLHLSWLAGEHLKGLGEALGAIRRVLVPGASKAGELGVIAQTRADAFRNAANEAIDNAAGGGGLSGLAGLPGAVSGNKGANMQAGERMAAQLGWTGRLWAALKSLWQGESGWDEGAFNKSSGATGIPQALPGSKMASEGKDWRTNAITQIRWGLKYIAERYGDPAKAYAAWLSRNPHWYQSGGVLPWAKGIPGMFVGHGGEWVLNDDQKSKLAGSLGVGISQLKQTLGFSGGPGEFQGGGELPFQARARLRDIRRGNFELPELNPIEPDDVLREFARLNRALDAMKRKAKESISKFTDRFIGEVDNLIREGGLFEQMETAIERRANLRQSALTRRTFSVRGGVITRRLDDDQVAAQQAKDAEAEAKELGDFRKQVSDVLREGADRLRAINARIAQIRRGGVTKDERDTLDELTKSRGQLIGQQRNVRTKLNDIDARIQQAVADRFDAAIQRINAEAERANREAGRGIGALDRQQRLDQARGITTDDSGQRTEIIGAQIKRLGGVAQRLRRRGDQQGAQDIEDQMADLQTQIQEIAISALHNEVQGINDAFDRRNTAISNASSIAQALGQTDVVANLRKASIDSMGAQVQQLMAELPKAFALGDAGGVQNLFAQIDQLTTQIQQTALDIFQAAVDDINERATRRLGRLDVAQRAIGLGGPMGTLIAQLAGVNTQADVFRARGTALQAQSDQLFVQFIGATMQGNIKASEDLALQIHDLNIQIVENTEAFRNFRIDAINARAGFVTSASGTAQSIVQTMGQAIGAVVSSPALRQLIGTSLGALSTQGTGLRAELKELIGRDVGPLNTPEAVTAFIQSIVPLVEALPDTLRTTGEGLINAILQNTQQVQENTNQLQQLNGTDTQSFSSTAWTLFRNAIFNGSGGLIPQIGLSSGLTPGPLGFQLPGAGGPNQNISLTINEAGGEIDPSALGNTIAFRLKHG